MRELRAGEVFGSYLIEGVLGRGGMGVVYRAREQAGLLDRTVALKLVRGTLASPEALERFRREARLAAALEHPAVVPVYAADVHEDVPFVAMRLIDGDDLATLIATYGPLEPDRALAIGRQIASALDAAHAAGLVHRDVKPANVLVSGEAAYLADFGLAVGDAASGAGELAGTLAYLAPELVTGSAASPASDRYALACTLVEALAGQPPYSARTRPELVAAHLDADPPALSQLHPGLAPAADAVVRDALAKSPDDRHTSSLELVEALAQALAGRVPAALALRLPAAPNRLLGREADVEQVAQLLETPGTRLVTLVGPGGVGKTRLALGVAERWPAGTSGWVALAPVQEEAGVLGAVAATLGVVELPSEPLAETIARELAARAPLLVIDNAEHLLGAAPQLAALLQGAPELRLLVTSQAPLRVSAEHVYPVAELPPEPAVELFLERAQAAGARVDHPEQVGGICAALDGLPLALELAAARLRSLDVDELARRLPQGLAVLGAGPRDVPERQRTMRAAIAWSYGLLDPPEQELLCGLAVFSGGFTLQAAEEVLGDGLLDPFEALVEGSLVRDRPGDAPGRRFGLLATIREFALEQLAAGEREPVLGRAHAEWVRRLAERADEQLLTADPEPEMVRLRDELANIRAALAWARERGERELHARIASGLGRFFSLAGLSVEGLRELVAAREASAGLPPEVAARLDARASLMAFELGDLDRAELWARAAVDALRAVGDDADALSALNTVAGVSYYRGDLAAAEAVLADEILPAARALGDRQRIADSLVNLSELALGRGEGARAGELADEGVAITRADGDRWGLAAALSQSAAAALAVGRPQVACERAAEAVEVFDALADRSAIMPALTRLGRAQTLIDQPAAAETLARAVAMARSSERHADVADALLGQAVLSGAQGDLELAARLLGEAEAEAGRAGMTLTRYPGDDQLEARISTEFDLARIRDEAAGAGVA